MRVGAWIVLGLVVALGAWATWRTGRGAGLVPPAPSGTPTPSLFEAVARAAKEVEIEEDLRRRLESAAQRHRYPEDLWQSTSSTPRWIEVVDDVTGRAVEALVEVHSLTLQLALQSLAPVPDGVVERQAARWVRSAEPGRFDLNRCHGDSVVLRVDGYVETLVPRASLGEQVRLQPLVPLRWRIEREADVAATASVTLWAGPRDGAGAPVPSGFMLRPRGRWRVGDFEQVVGTAIEGVLLVPPGRYAVVLSDPADDEASWRCETAQVSAPGAATLRVAPGPELRIDVQTPKGAAAVGVVWLADPLHGNAEQPLQVGVARFATAARKNGRYLVGGCGDGWVAVPAAVVLRDGRAEPSQLRLETRGVVTAHLVVEAEDPDQLELARVHERGGWRYLSARPDAAGVAVARRGADCFVTGIGELPCELLVLDESRQRRRARLVVTQGGGRYPVRFDPVPRRRVVNGPNFAAAFCERHGQRGASFRVEACIELPGNREVWQPLVHLDYVSNPVDDPRKPEAWEVACDAARPRHRIAGYRYLDGRSVLTETADVIWQ